MLNIQQHTDEYLNDKLTSILRTHSQDSLAYFHLQENRMYYFSPSGESFLSYKIIGKIAVVAADPVGPKSELKILIRSFIVYLKQWGLKPCFLSVNLECAQAIQELGLKIAKIGEEAMLDLPVFKFQKLKKKVRRAVRHIEQLGIEIYILPSSQVSQSIYIQINNISTEWLVEKGRKEKGFSMTLGRIPTKYDRDCQIVIAVKGNEVLGFLSFTPIYRTQGLSLDLIRYKKNSPNGINEFMIIKSAEYFKTKNISTLSLNFATFSNIFNFNDSVFCKFGQLASHILMKLYSSDKLRKFNEKFYPYWKDRYIAFSAVQDIPLCLYAILVAER